MHSLCIGICANYCGELQHQRLKDRDFWRMSDNKKLALNKFKLRSIYVAIFK